MSDRVDTLTLIITSIFVTIGLVWSNLGSQELRNIVYSIIIIPTSVMSVYSTFIKGRVKGPKVQFVNPGIIQVVAGKTCSVLTFITNTGDMPTVIDGDVSMGKNPTLRRFFDDFQQSVSGTHFSNKTVLQPGEFKYALIDFVPVIDKQEIGSVLVELALSDKMNNRVYQELELRYQNREKSNL